MATPQIASSKLDDRKQVQILDLHVDRIDLNGVLQRVEGFIEDGSAHHLMTVNIRFMSIANSNDDFANIVNDAHITVADGMPLVWMSKMLGTPIPQRITGTDLMNTFSGFAEQKGHSVFLLGGEPGLADAAAEKLLTDYPGLKVAGTYHGFFKPEEERQVIDYIRDCKPEFLFVGLGSPRQDFWIRQWSEELNVPVCLGIGGTMEVLTGRLNRAPKWMQRSGLEWFYRMKQEPRRLWRRYVLEDVPTTLKALAFVLKRLVASKMRMR